MSAPEAAETVTVPPVETRPCNYSAPEHDPGPTRRFAPGWRCAIHTPGAISQRHDQTGTS